MDIRQLNRAISVTGQLFAADLVRLKELGFSTVINNRPDGETRDQPSSAQIRLAADAARLAYHHIPLGHDGVTSELVLAMRMALAESNGPALAYCRLGVRSVTLWAFAQVQDRSGEDIIAEGGRAGYDISHMAQLLERERLQARPAAQLVTSAALRLPVNASARPWAMSGPNLKPWPEQALRTQAAGPMGSTTKRSSSVTV